MADTERLMNKAQGDSIISALGTIAANILQVPSEKLIIDWSYTTLPASGNDHTIYAIPTGDADDPWDFYVWNDVDEEWVQFDWNFAVDSALSTTSENPVQNKVVKGALDGKVDTVSGKGLSTNDYTNEDKASVAESAKQLESTQTVSGNPLTLTDCAPINAESLVVELEPKQDLHGQQYPYVGGAGKNKLPMTVDGIKAVNTSGTWSGNVYSINNGTFTILTDDGGNVTGIKVNGTFTANTLLTLGTTSLNGSYILNGCPNGGYMYTYRMDLRRSTGGDILYTDEGSGVNINNINESVYAVIRIQGQYQASNLVFLPMLRLATETDPTFAPYSNICPITGYTQMSVETLTDIQSYYDIQTIVRAGKAQEVFNIGDEIPVKYTATNGTQYDMPFRVVAFQNVELQDGTTKQGMFLQSKYATLEGVQFDAPEPDNTLGSGGAKDDKVASYGYNRWSESGIRAWLNSDAAANNWWGSTFERGGQTVSRRAADVAPTQLASVNGFMRGLPSSFVDVLGKVKMQTSCNTVTDSGVTDTTYDKIFLASLEQMYTTPQVSGVEGDYFEYWKEALGLNSPSSWHPTTYEAYKTYALENHNSAQYVRLRSARRGYSNNTWYVYSGGYIASDYGGYAGSALRSAPVCVIC